METVTPKRKKKMIGWVALGITVVIIAMIAFRIDDWSRDWTQNFARLTPDADREGLQPVVMVGTVDETKEQIRRWAEINSRWNIESESDSGTTPGRIHLTRTTPVLRFVDDIEVVISPQSEGNGVVVDASSQSRVGKGDLGQNPRNLIELTTFLRQSQQPGSNSR